MIYTALMRNAKPFGAFDKEHLQQNGRRCLADG